MPHQTRCKSKANSIKRLMIIGTAALSMGIVTPASAEIHSNNISFDGFNFDENEDILEQLIELDADDIEDIREEMAEASVEIREAISEIADAREEVKSVPGGSAILEAALSIASKFAEKAIDEGFSEIRTELDRVEGELLDLKGKLSAEEFSETQMVINIIRSEMAEIDIALSELLQAMSA